MNLPIKDLIDISVQLGHFQLDNSITEDLLQAIVDEKRIDCIQSTEPLKDETLRLLNKHLFSKRDDVWLRLYYLDILDMSCFEYLPSLKLLQIDLIKDVKNVESLSLLKKLKSLNIRIESLKSFSLLQHVTTTLKTLNLGKTKSKRPDLAEVLRFTSLENLDLRGHNKNIHRLAELKTLQSLTLGGMTVKDISWLESLPNLENLSIDILKTDDFKALENSKTLKSFSVSELRGVTELPFLEKMKGLEELDLTYLNKVKQLPDLGSKESLKSIFIYEMESLEDISFLYECKNLETAQLRFSNKIKVEYLEKVFSLPKLRSARVVVATIDNEAAIEEMMLKYGLEIIK